MSISATSRNIDEMIEKDWRETDRTYGVWPGIVGFAAAAGIIVSMFALATGFA